jgi:hypothetical protein
MNLLPITPIDRHLVNIASIRCQEERIKVGGMITYLEEDGDTLLREFKARQFSYNHVESDQHSLLEPTDVSNIVDRAINVITDTETKMYTVMSESLTGTATIEVYFLPFRSTTAQFREFIDEYMDGLSNESYVPPYKTVQTN